MTDNVLKISTYITNYILLVNKFLKQFSLNEFTKIKFTGKGYKIRKNSPKSMILLFNRAHISILW